MFLAKFRANLPRIFGFIQIFKHFGTFSRQHVECLFEVVHKFFLNFVVIHADWGVHGALLREGL